MFQDSGSYLQSLKDEHFRANVLSHMIFDKHGQLLVRDTTKCQWAGGGMIRTLHPDSTFATTKEVDLDGIIRVIIPFGSGNRYQGQEKPFDFTVVVTWAKFIGRYNYRLFDLEKAIEENKHARIRLIWLNIDMQKSWHLKPDQKVRFK